jgi:hypothetical protein
LEIRFRSFALFPLPWPARLGGCGGEAHMHQPSNRLWTLGLAVLLDTSGINRVKLRLLPQWRVGIEEVIQSTKDHGRARLAKLVGGA